MLESFCHCDLGFLPCVAPASSTKLESEDERLHPLESQAAGCSVAGRRHPISQLWHPSTLKPKRRARGQILTVLDILSLNPCTLCMSTQC